MATPVVGPVGPVDLDDLVGPVGPVGPVGAIVLAAGAGRRFGGGKLLASLEGRPVLQHVLDALAEAGIDDPVVVLGEDAPALERAIDWREARRVRNPDPERGLASSLQLGWKAALAGEPGPAAVVVALGDQPRLEPGVIRVLLSQPADRTRPVVVARHDDGARNPVRLEPAAGALVEAASGDRGLGPLLDARPELVRTVDAGEANPDVDTRGDLVALLADAWARRVRGNAAQVDRYRDLPDGADFYAPVTRIFVADPARQNDPVLEALLALAQPGDTWLDIGAGAGRYALPLARHVAEVIALDPSTSMLDALRAGMEAHGIPNVRVVSGRWPPGDHERAVLGPDPIADGVLIAHVGYDVEAILPFLDAMEAAARSRCVAVLMEHSPATAAAPFWPLVHGEARVALPALPEFVELIRARGSNPTVTPVGGDARRFESWEELERFVRHQLWTDPSGPKEARLQAALDRLAIQEEEGWAIRDRPSNEIGIVTWSSRQPAA